MHVIYHYFPASYLPDILATGELRPSAAGGGAGERPAIWFTLRPTYEPTAVKLLKDHSGVRLLTLAEQAERSGLARVVAPDSVAPIAWGDWARSANVRPMEVKRMVSHAKQLRSDVSLYRASFDPVSLTECFRVEISTDGVTWAEWPYAELGH